LQCGGTWLRYGGTWPIHLTVPLSLAFGARLALAPPRLRFEERQ
jgi:hypothetical protein